MKVFLKKESGSDDDDDDEEQRTFFSFFFLSFYQSYEVVAMSHSDVFSY